METINLETHIIDSKGRLKKLAVREYSNINNRMVYSCIMNNKKEILISVNEKGRWIEVNKGRSQYATILGDIIERHFA